MTIRDKIRDRPKLWASAVLATAGLAGGAVIGSALSANAVTGSPTPSTPASSTAPSGTGTAPSPPPPGMPAHGSAAHEAAESPVTGSAATQAQQAAVKYLGSGTAGSVTTDFTKNGYEVTVTKSDGSQVEVHEDSSFNVIQGGFGHGPGRWGGPPDSASNPAPNTSA